MRYSRFVGVLGVVLVGVVMPATASAATIEVTTKNDQFGGGPGKCSLREAIQAANSDARFGGCRRGDGTDKIELGDATYTLTRSQAATEDANTEGDLDITESLRIVGAGRTKSKVDGNGDVTEERVFDVNARTRFSRLTIRGGDQGATDGGNAGGIQGYASITLARSSVRGNRAFVSGGGIHSGPPLTLIRTTVSGNSAGAGGGVFTDIGGSIRGSTIRDNRATHSTGGGIANSGTLTVTRSTVTNNFSEDDGGGIHHRFAGTVFVRNSTVSGNDTGPLGFGGGIRTEDAGASVTNSVIRGNDGGAGGGMLVDGPFNLTRTTVRGNSGAFGGGLFLSEHTGANTIRRSVVRGNDAAFGGGIASSGPTTITHTTIRGNRADAHGGGISHALEPSLTVTHSALIENTAGENGGGLRVDGTSNFAALINVTLHGNRAAQSGGAVALNEGNAAMTNTTTTGNSADADSNDTGNGGGISLASGFGSLDLENSVIANNRDLSAGALRAARRGAGAIVYPDCSGETASAFSLIRNHTGCTITPDPDSLPAGTDPQLGPLVDNGGPTLTRALRAGSPLINAGTPSPNPGVSCALDDQRGVPRPIGECDIGAYERVTCFGKAVDVVGTDGRNRLRGSNGPDVFLALGGNDRVIGRKGNDRACGGEGDDKLFGNEGNDRLNGGPGNDTCVGGPGRDELESC